jgi:hypothetical protein
VSLLTACQAVVKETGVGVVPATVIGNTETTAVQLNALAERCLKKLSKMDWQALLKEHTITTANGTETYALPSDWARYVMETAWDATNYWPMKGSIHPQLWQALKRGIASTPSSRKEYRVRGNLVYIYPIPTATETLVLEYARNTPWTDSTGVTYRAAATADGDIPVVPSYLLELEMLWRWRRAKGLDYAEEKNEAEYEIMRAFGMDTPAPVLDFGRGPMMTPPFLANIPTTV